MSPVSRRLGPIILVPRVVHDVTFISVSRRAREDAYMVSPCLAAGLRIVINAPPSAKVDVSAFWSTWR